MKKVTIHEAKTHLSSLIRDALSGEDIAIAKRKELLVRLQVVKPKSKAGKRPLGWAAGSGFYMSKDFDAPLKEFEDYM